MTERVPLVVAPICDMCDSRVYFAAKSHRHYTHLRETGCPVRKVMDIKMITLMYRDQMKP